MTLVAGMAGGADSIDDMDLLRRAGMGQLFTAVRAPSWLGTFSAELARNAECSNPVLFRVAFDLHRTVSMGGHMASTDDPTNRPPSSDDPPKTDPPKLVFPTGIAWVVLVILLALLLVVLWQLLAGSWKNLSTATMENLPPQLAAPLLFTGLVLVLVGAAMSAIEWAAGFDFAKKSTAGTLEATEKGPELIGESAKLVEALSKLKAAALILISGVILLFATAWIASSAASSDTPPQPSPSASSPSTPAG